MNYPAAQKVYDLPEKGRITAVKSVISAKQKAASVGGGFALGEKEIYDRRDAESSGEG